MKKYITYITTISTSIVIYIIAFNNKSFFQNKGYLLLSFLLIFSAIIPFLISYERKRPPAREVVLLSSLTIIATLSRILFFPFPQIKPMGAIIILSAIIFGKNAGFLIGLLSVFISNMFIGQGPWSLYQAIAFGMIGFLSGIIFSHIKPTTFNLLIYTFFSILLIYGLIVNISSLLLYTKNSMISIKLIITYLMAGLPFDLIHAISCSFFIYFLKRPFIEKMNRVKIKYGIIKI